MTGSRELVTPGLALELARVSEAAALASSTLVGRGDEAAADHAAMTAMGTALATLETRGTVVVGEGNGEDPQGRGDENSGTVGSRAAPALFTGARVGTGRGMRLDIALDPLEGATLAAKDMPGALATIAVAPQGTMLRAPDVYMDKLAIGPGYAVDTVTLDMAPHERVEALAKARGCTPAEITVCVLERPRHADLIAQLRRAGAGVRLITDGDVAGVIECAESDRTGTDMYMGSGGAPEGVLAAAALKSIGGQIQGRFVFRNDDERRRARSAGISDPGRIYTRDDMIRGDVIFAATGVTDGSLLRGVRRDGTRRISETIVMCAHGRIVRRITCQSPAS